MCGVVIQVEAKLELSCVRHEAGMPRRIEHESAAVATWRAQPPRIRVVKWLNTTPALGVCSVCSREFKVPMNALKRTADAQASLQEQFDRHKCQSLDSSEVNARANVLLRQEPDEEDDEEEDDRREEDDDDDEGHTYSE